MHICILKTMEVLGGHDSSVAVFVNAHHSIGCRALVLFGTKEQQAQWLPGLLDGSKLCAFALTEPDVGSDPARMQCSAVPTEDGSAYLINGQKLWTTNGVIAEASPHLRGATMAIYSFLGFGAGLISPLVFGIRITCPIGSIDP